jgi:Spy/CpxP family protein refolding chaperone
MNNLRTLKQLALTAGLFALCCVPAVRAQATPQQSPSSDSMQQAAPQHKHGDEMASLNLTDDQKAQVQKIHGDMKSQLSSVKSDTTLTPDQKQAKIREIRKSSREQINQVLTPAQRAQWKAEHHAEKQQSSQAAPPPQQ